MEGVTLLQADLHPSRFTSDHVIAELTVATDPSLVSNVRETLTGQLQEAFARRRAVELAVLPHAP